MCALTGGQSDWGHVGKYGPDPYSITGDLTSPGMKRVLDTETIGFDRWILNKLL
jgi:hypothetical protein